MVELFTDAEKELHTKACFSHTSGIRNDGYATLVGYHGARNWGSTDPDYYNGNYGWRPALIEEVGNSADNIVNAPKKDNARLTDQIIRAMSKLHCTWSEDEIDQIKERYDLPSFSTRDIQYIRKMERDSTIASLRESIRLCIESIQSKDDSAKLFVKYVLPLIDILNQREKDLKEKIESDFEEKTKFY